MCEELERTTGCKVAAGSPVKVSILAEYPLEGEGERFLEHAGSRAVGAALLRLLTSSPHALVLALLGCATAVVGVIAAARPSRLGGPSTQTMRAPAYEMK
jgi:hypothetical protein